MPDLVVTMSVAPSILTDPLLNGEVVPKGIDLQPRKGNVQDNSRNFAQSECDVTEVEISTAVRAIEDSAPFRALPLFTSGRRFVQPGIWFKFRKGINLSSLRGRIVVATRYWSPSVLWQRKMLGMVYGVDPEDVSWVTLEPEAVGATPPHQVLLRLETAGRILKFENIPAMNRGEHRKEFRLHLILS